MAKKQISGEIALQCKGQMFFKPHQIAWQIWAGEGKDMREEPVVWNYRPDNEYKGGGMEDRDFAGLLAMGWSPAWPVDVIPCPKELGEKIQDSRQRYLDASKLGGATLQRYHRIWGDGVGLTVPEYVGISGYRRSRLLNLIEELLHDNEWREADEHDTAPTWDDWGIYANVYPLQIKGQVKKDDAVYLKILELQLQENREQEGQKPVSEVGNLFPASVYFKQGKPLSWFTKTWGSKGHKYYMACYLDSLRPRENLLERWQGHGKDALKFSQFDAANVSRLKNGNVPPNAEIPAPGKSIQPDQWIRDMGVEVLMPMVIRSGVDPDNKPMPRKEKIQDLYKMNGIAPQFKQLVAWVTADSAEEEKKYTGILAELRGIPEVSTSLPVPQPEPPKERKGKK